MQQNKLNLPEQGIALLVPCFNAEPYINSFLANVALLTQPFDEIIFYDDASTDNTRNLLQSKGLKVIFGTENKGPGYARNRLAAASSCPYIHFHDIDDEFNPAFVEIISKKLNHAPADVILGYADWIDAETRTPVLHWKYNQTEINTDPLSYFLTHPLGIINTIYRQTAFLNVSGFNETIKCWEDADIHIRLAASGATFGVIEEVLAYSLRHGNGISQNQSKCWNCRLQFLSLYLTTYRHINRKIFEAELIKIKNAFINLGAYHLLGQIVVLKKKHQLQVTTTNSLALYWLSNVLPSAMISKALQLFRMLSKLVKFK